MVQPPRRFHGGEFSEQLGDRQVAGSPNITGVLPVPVNAPVGLAPPSPVQVQSVFDTRPLSGYDFAFDGFFKFGGEAGTDNVSVQVPNGYSAVLRTVEFEFTPPIANAVDVVGSGGPASMALFLLRDGGTLPSNVVRLRGVAAEYRWLTHQVYGQAQTMGARIAFDAGGAAPIYNPVDDGLDVTVRFFGVLIPYRGLPPTEEVGSDPVMVRDYVQMQGGPK